jgi:hypothetical protein
MQPLSKREDGSRRKRIGFRSSTIIALLHVQLWCSVVAIVAGALMLRDPADTTDFGSAIVILVVVR